MDKAVNASPEAGILDVRAALYRHLVGRETLIDCLIVALLAKGHVLIEGAPGLAKTRAVKLFASMLKADFSRVQATPDLLPADITGTNVYRQATGTFDFNPGPLFANIVLVDEINRAPPKVQSALLEAMAERQITTDGKTRALNEPFMVAATQNPIEHEGTYPLPEAQLDRFLFFVDIPFPGADEEAQILDLALAENAAPQRPSVSAGPKAIAEASGQLRAVHLSPAVRDYAVRLTLATRGQGKGGKAASLIEHPASPRGSIGMALAAQGFAWLAGRDFVLPEDIRKAAPLVLSKRIGLTYRAIADGKTSLDVISAILDATPPV